MIETLETASESSEWQNLYFLLGCVLYSRCSYYRLNTTNFRIICDVIHLRTWIYSHFTKIDTKYNKLNLKIQKPLKWHSEQKWLKTHQMKQNLLGTKLWHLAQFEWKLKRNFSIPHNDYDCQNYCLNSTNCEKFCSNSGFAWNIDTLKMITFS